MLERVSGRDERYHDVAVGAYAGVPRPCQSQLPRDSDPLQPQSQPTEAVTVDATSELKEGTQDSGEQ
jgi:hypothetical protein